MKRLALACSVVWLAACPSVESLVSCDAQGNAKPLCGFQNPEDLVLVPGGGALLVSEYGGMDRGDPGAIVRLDLASEKRTVLFRDGDADPAARAWGASDCPGPPDGFSPHGIDLVTRDDGRRTLLVVNHAGRESVEFFEVLGRGTETRVEWRGCALPPEGSWLNEVAGLRDGGFVTSHMMPLREGELARTWELMKTGWFGVVSGYVYQWSPAEGFTPVPGTEVRFANGVAVSRDGTIVYVNSSSGGVVRAVERSSGKLLAEAEIQTPDNSSWTPDGRLLVASLTAPALETQACNGIEAGACSAGFEIWSLDPESFEATRVYTSDGVTMGAGTVGLQVGSELFIGTFAGDRILRVQL